MLTSAEKLFFRARKHGKTLFRAALGLRDLGRALPSVLLTFNKKLRILKYFLRRESNPGRLGERRVSSPLHSGPATFLKVGVLIFIIVTILR